MARLRVDAALHQGLGVLHGAVVFALADSAAASMLVASAQGPAATSDAQIRFLAPVTSGELCAISRVVHESGRSVLVEVEVRDEAEALVALYSAKFVRPRT